MQSNQCPAHLISHHRGLHPSYVVKHFAQWIPDHIAWIWHVSKDYLEQKHIDVTDYAHNLLNKHFAHDELVLLIFAQMYHIHIKVITKKGK